ncbi:MAG: dihydropteroate synthase [Gemmatimonadetes bacterium]|nr:dihydropteroate synthase [Gemmatimonadota bacterium]
MRRGVVSLEQPVVVGILNVTPDSFSDGGRHLEPDRALAHAEALVADGAAMLDLGAESTRPHTTPVAEDEEWRRLEPVLTGVVLRFPQVPVSVDTVKAATALMHSRGAVRTMATYQHATYQDVTAEVSRELQAAVTLAEQRGVPRGRIVLDPGLGFSKTPEQSYQVLGGLPALARLGLPVMIGPSRKRFLGAATGRDVAERDVATAAACAIGWLLGARLFRVHAVAPTRDALAVAHAARLS